MLGPYLGSHEIKEFKKRIEDNIARVILIKWKTEGEIDADLTKYPNDDEFLNLGEDLSILFNNQTSNAP